MITYKLDEANKQWVSQACVLPPFDTRDYSGLALSIQGDNNRVAITSQKDKSVWFGKATGIKFCAF